MVREEMGGEVVARAMARVARVVVVTVCGGGDGMRW